MEKLQVSNRAALRGVLKDELSESKDFRFLHRVHCVLLVGEGCNCYDLARWFDENPQTIERWVHYCEESGLAGLRGKQRPGRPTKLNYEQMKALSVAVNNLPRASGYIKSYWGGHLLATHIANQYGVELSDRQCQRILRRLQGQLICSEELQPSKPK